MATHKVGTWLNDKQQARSEGGNLTPSFDRGERIENNNGGNTGKSPPYASSALNKLLNDQSDEDQTVTQGGNPILEVQGASASTVKSHLPRINVQPVRTPVKQESENQQYSQIMSAINKMSARTERQYVSLEQQMQTDRDSTQQRFAKLEANFAKLSVHERADQKVNPKNKREPKYKKGISKRYYKTYSSDNERTSDSEVVESDEEGYVSNNSLRSIEEAANLNTKNRSFQYQEVIHKNDVASLKEGDDLHMFFYEFDNSYIKDKCEEEKIFKLKNKVQRVPAVRELVNRMCERNLKYTTIRRRVLDALGKSPEDVLKEFKKLEQKPDETMVQFVRRLHVFLSAPAGQFSKSQVIEKIYARLPELYHNNIQEAKLGNHFESFLRKVKKVQQFQDSIACADRQSASTTSSSHTGYHHKYEDHGHRDTSGSGKQWQNQGSQGHYQQGQGRGPGRNQGKGRGNRQGWDPNHQQGYYQQQNPPPPQSQANSSTHHMDTGYVQQPQQYASNQQQQAPPPVPTGYVQHPPQYSPPNQAYPSPPQYPMPPQPPPSGVPTGFVSTQTTSNVQSVSVPPVRTASRHAPIYSIVEAEEQVIKDSQRQGTPMVKAPGTSAIYPSHPYNTRFQAQQQASQQSAQNTQNAPAPQQETFMETEQTNQSQPQGSQRNPNTQDQGWQFFQQRTGSGEVNTNQIQGQIQRFRNKNEPVIVLPPGTFIDENGDFNISQAMKSIHVLHSFEDMVKWKTRIHAGDVPIYYGSQGEKLPVPLNDFFKQVNDLNQIAQSQLHVKREGSHLLLRVTMDNTPVDVIVDTGACRSLVSRTFAERFLPSKIAKYDQDDGPRLATVGGAAECLTYLKDVNVAFEKQTITLDLPIVQEWTRVDILLGQDVLQGLRNVAIFVNELKFQYEVQVDNSWQTVSMPLQLDPEMDKPEVPIGACYMDYFEDRWPNIGAIDQKYDLALLDLPVQYPTFHGSHPRYSTAPIRDFVVFKAVLDKVMKPSSILLTWCSGKTIADTLYLLNAWGYTYVNIIFVWVKLDKNGKLKLGLGFWTRQNCEFIVMGNKSRTGSSLLRGGAKNMS